MNSKKIAFLILALTVAVWTTGCSRDEGELEPAPISTDPIVFTDNFGSNVDYQAFLNSKLDAVQIDTEVKFNGTASLRVSVPGPDDPSGWFAGGAFVDAIGRDFTGYDALTFYARCSKASATLNVAGLANDNTGTSKYEASTGDIALTTSWEKYIVPIPLPGKLGFEKGLFYFAEGYEDDNIAYTIWFDDIIFEKTGLISNPRPSIANQTTNTFVGAILNVSGTSTTFDVYGSDIVMDHLPDYFTFASSDIAVVDVIGEDITVVGAGNATITAVLGSVSATGDVSIHAEPAPAAPAPTPSIPAGDVISLFSDAYTDVEVGSWSADWPDMADVTDFSIAGDPVKAYTNLVYAGILFEGALLIDASSMEYLHMDVWAPGGATFFKIKLIDFGANGSYLGGDDSEWELTFNGGTTPPFISGAWSSLDIPLSDFMVAGGLESTAHLAQMIISGGDITAFVDNVYFYRLPPGARDGN